MPEAEAKTQITEVRTVGVPVSDQARALEFYVGTLGFEKRLDVPLGADARWIEVAPTGAGTTIALVATGGDGPVGVETGVRFSTEDAGADHAELLSAGVDVGDVLRWEGVPPMFTFHDRDGNGLVVVEQA